MIVLQILGLFIIASIFLYNLVDVIIEFDDRSRYDKESIK